ncbi:hypothetical protein KXW65_004694 [Aspergillus fumigatus]|nr:hypothetical protein KXX06_005356 [Aspergillus fumigatus]KAH1679006.1 hypothetical protein KXX65_003362 [Aspergillus fumigatus]KAH1764895.1 hypothetical protein KXX09_003523 [Aspergillus fumigatus]KAH1819748.1 hypothetical protein KXX19_006759 [Aspergillus fumigatus]KAH2029389.1 hypothetical protein KXV45_006557 [Aspergillus fumigatus]
MSDTLSDADKIRNKRLAKLGNPSSSSQNASGPETASTQPSTPSLPSPSPQQTFDAPQPQISISSAPRSQTSSPRLELQESEGKRIKITPSAPASPAPESVADTPVSNTPPPPKAEESIESFEDRTLSAVFKLSLREDRQRDIHGHKLIYLPGLRSELEDQGREPRIDTTVLDQALLEAASNTQQKPLDYLLPCWGRISRLHKGFRRAREDDPKFAVISEARRLCMSYCIFAITMPEMFGLEPSERSPLKPYLLLDPEDDKGVDLEFLGEAVKRFEEDESIKPAFIAAVEEMSRDLASMTINDDYKSYLIALRNLVGNPVIAAAITESSFFNECRDPALFEKETLLGPWFRLSPLQGNVTMTYFSSPKTRDQSYILNAQRSMRMIQQMLSSDLFDVVNHIIRANKEARDRVLDWFAAALNINHKRRAMQVDPTTVASDGFMFNLTTCLDKLCEPFMDATFTKIDRIDAGYLHRNPRVDMKDETKINADQHASDAFYSKQEEGTTNFITEIFFLTVAAHHYGSESLTSKLDQLEKDLRHMEGTIRRFELERPRWIHNPVQLRVFEQALRKYKDKLDLGLALKYSLQGVLFDDQWQARSMLFMRYVIVWLLRLVSGVNFPKEPIKLPLPEQQPEVFKCLPEYFVDDIVSNFKFIMWCMPQIITATQGDELVMLCITFLESSDYIKNPYLKAGLVSILFRGTWPRPGGARGVLVDLLNSFPFANEYLLHAVMKFYIEAEHTGTHTQFFDKFNIRYEIFQIIKCIWPNTLYRNKLYNQSKQNLDFFVRFVNLLLNDVTYVLDESFGAFITIHDTQVELSRNGNNMDPQERQQKEEHLASAQRNAKSYMQLTNETVAMLKLFTEALADSFTMPEIVQRLADMLDYNLDAMVGPKSSSLRVDNLQEYGFNPRALLSEIVDVYLNLMGKENFILAVARDGRSYKPANFQKAGEILRKWSLKSPEELQQWEQLQAKVRAAKEADEQAEEDLGEIPDEFLDPLIYTLMEDPVILPGSKVSMDRSTLRSHLLSDPHDPFNRAPLKMEDVTPDTELKARIDAFKAERLAARRQPLTQTAYMGSAFSTFMGSLPPLRDLILPTPQAYTTLLNIFQYFPVFSLVQWAVSWHPAGKGSYQRSWLNIPGKLGWFLMEIVGPANLLYILYKLPPALNITSLPLSNKLVASLYVIHYVNRAIISPFFAAPSMSPMHASVVSMAVLFNWLNSTCLAGWLVGYHVPVLGYKTDGAVSGAPGGPSSYSAATHFLPCLGMVLFAAGMIGNIHSERTLFHLRREAAEKRDAAEKSDEDITQHGDEDHPTFIQASSSSSSTDADANANAKGRKNKYDKVYVIPPARGVFRSILYPHYAFEWLEWLGFSLVGTAIFPAAQALAYASPPLHIAPWLKPAAALAETLQVPLPLPAVVFVVNAVANMLPHARWGRKWYVEKFGEKAVAGRGAAVPWCPWL